MTARKAIDRDFRGLSSNALMAVVHSSGKTVDGPAFRSAIRKTETTLKSDSRVSTVVPPRPGVSISKDNHTAIIQAGAAADSNTMVRTADDLKVKLGEINGNGVDVSLTGASGMWSDFGFILLLVALQSPVIAAAGVLTSLLGTTAAFGVARLIFPDGHLAGLLGFESQGFVDAWGPVFFFAMIFAISMDYTVFLLSSAREHWERTGDAKEAMVGGLAHSGRVIFAAAAVMVAVFFTFALSGPLPPKEMGVILGVAVLLDGFLVRLLLLPVLLRLLGPAAWWLPGPLRQLLPEVSFSHD